jgi:Cof subfamily protein (haloacid dehalogenase superfamily)
VTATTTKYKLLLLDLEGTLLSSKGTIHAQNLQKIRQLVEGGLRVSFIAQRGPKVYEALFDSLHPNAPVIYFDGAMIRDVASGEIRSRHTLSLDDALTTLAVADFMGLEACLFVDEEAYISRRATSREAIERAVGAETVVVADLVDHLESLAREPIKIFVTGQPESFGTFAEEVRRSARQEPTLHSLNAGLLEISAESVSRINAASELVELLELQLDDVIAFGDDLDDIELLRECGIGVAMSNGHAELLGSADVIIDSHDTDAIAFYLDGEFDLREGVLTARR